MYMNMYVYVCMAVSLKSDLDSQLSPGFYDLSRYIALAVH